MQVRRSWAAPALAALLATAGTLHFVAPAPFDALVPTALPGGPRFWTLVSGAVELTVAVAVAVPRTRRLGGLTAAVLFVAVFPGNVKMAIDWSDRSLAEQALAYGRLPLQVPLVLWALKVRRDTRGVAERPSISTVTARDADQRPHGAGPLITGRGSLRKIHKRPSAHDRRVGRRRGPT